MDDPITADFPTRVALEEEEEKAQATAESLLQPPTIELLGRAPSEEGALDVAFLMVAEGPAACTLVRHCTSTKQAIGSITLAALPAEADELQRRSHGRHRTLIYKVEPSAIPGSGAAAAATTATATAGVLPAGAMLLALCELPVPAERANAWVSALAAHVQPAHTLVISSIPAHEYCGQGDPSQDVLLYRVETAAAATAASKDPEAVPRLPSGTLVSGLPAAIISQCQVRARSAALLIGVQMAPVPDRGFVEGLASAAEYMMTRSDARRAAFSFGNAQMIAKACSELERKHDDAPTSSIFA